MCQMITSSGAGSLSCGQVPFPQRAVDTLC